MVVNGAGSKRVTVLGSTGSVGRLTCELLERGGGAYEVEALTANKDWVRLAAQARTLRARLAVVADPSAYQNLKDALAGTGIEAAAGASAVAEAAARPAGWVMSAIVGAAGLPPTLEAVRRGAVVAFANKETLVCAGDLMTAEVVRHGATLLPVDSEHNAIFQVFDAPRRASVERLILTASGGPFRNWTRDRMAAATPAEAVAHPVWSMGAKISVDSATMMNKALELIEAHYLFAMPEDRIDVLVHPQSVVHSMVEYIDGSVLAQLGTPDMRIPIAYALAWPDRMPAAAARLDLAQVGALTFEPPDDARFPALRVARVALQTKGGGPTILNAANETAVQAFLDGRIGFLDIERVNEETLSSVDPGHLSTLDDVLALDAGARRHAEAVVGRLSFSR